MVYIIHKDIRYRDILDQRIDVGLYYVEEKDINNPKDYVLFGTECCKEFVEEEVFFDSKEAHEECFKRNQKLLDLILDSINDNIRGIKGIINPDDYCGKGERKND